MEPTLEIAKTLRALVLTLERDLTYDAKCSGFGDAVRAVRASTDAIIATLEPPTKPTEQRAA